MRDPINFAILVSQITNLRGSCLNEWDIGPIAETINKLTAAQSVDSIDRLLACMQRGQKIEAIKHYRSLTGAALKESKDAVERYWIAPPVPAGVRG